MYWLASAPRHQVAAAAALATATWVATASGVGAAPPPQATSKRKADGGVILGANPSSSSAEPIRAAIVPVSTTANAHKPPHPRPGSARPATPNPNNAHSIPAPQPASQNPRSCTDSLHSYTARSPDRTAGRNTRHRPAPAPDHSHRNPQTPEPERVSADYSSARYRTFSSEKSHSGSNTAISPDSLSAACSTTHPSHTHRPG